MTEILFHKNGMPYDKEYPIEIAFSTYPGYDGDNPPDSCVIMRQIDEGSVDHIYFNDKDTVKNVLDTLTSIYMNWDEQQANNIAAASKKD